MKNQTQTDLEKLLYKLILQFSIFTRGSHKQLDPHLLNLSQKLKQGINFHKLTPELKELSKTLAQLSASESSAESFTPTLYLLKEFIDRLIHLLSETEIPLIFKQKFTLLSKKSKSELDEQKARRLIDLALQLLVDIKDHAIAEQQNIEAFLIDMSTQFNKLEGHALNVSKSNDQSIENRESLSDAINVQVNNIKESSSSATDLTSLQKNISQHLKELNFQVLKYQKIEIDRQLENNKLLDQMAQQIKDMEVEADFLRNNLKVAHDKALHDSLTQIPNRMAYDERAYLEFCRWRRYKYPLSLIIWDIDLFKSINDEFGHRAGDKTLALVAQLIVKSCRETDFIARYGGEEFVMLLPNTDSEQAFIAAEKIRTIVADSGFNHQGVSIKLTISSGISQFLDNDELNTVFERADQALYASKQQGRNRCTIKICK